jgi:hypothetical protein
MKIKRKCWMCNGDGKIGNPIHLCGNCGGTGEEEISEAEAKQLLLQDEIRKRKL